MPMLKSEAPPSRAFDPIGAAAMPAASCVTGWNLALDKATEACTMYWCDCAAGGPPYVESLYEMTLCAVDMSWEDACRSIRRALEKIPGQGLTFAAANEKAIDLFKLYRHETQSRGGDWNRPFPREMHATSNAPQIYRPSLAVVAGEAVLIGTGELVRDKLARKDFSGIFSRGQKEGEDLHAFFDRLEKVPIAASVSASDADFAKALAVIFCLEDKKKARFIGSSVTQAGFTYSNVKEMALKQTPEPQESSQPVELVPAKSGTSIYDSIRRKTTLKMLCRDDAYGGGCKRGRTCPFSHDKAHIDADRKRNAKVRCASYAAGQSCYYGASCPFSHHTSDSRSRTRSRSRSAHQRSRRRA